MLLTTPVTHLFTSPNLAVLSWSNFLRQLRPQDRSSKPCVFLMNVLNSLNLSSSPTPTKPLDQSDILSLMLLSVTGANRSAEYIGSTTNSWSPPSVGPSAHFRSFYLSFVGLLPLTTQQLFQIFIFLSSNSLPKLQTLPLAKKCPISPRKLKSSGVNSINFLKTTSAYLSPAYLLSSIPAGTLCESCHFLSSKKILF